MNWQPLRDDPNARVIIDPDPRSVPVLSAGEVVRFRDLSAIVSTAISSKDHVPGKYRLSPYRTEAGEHGVLLSVNERQAEFDESGAPPPFDLPVSLPGWYEIRLGFPVLDLRPRLSFPTGIDVAIGDSGKETFVHVGPEFGSRHGRMMGPLETEVICFFTCADLSDRTIRFRPPFGTPLSHPLGLIRATLSSITLRKMGETEVERYLSGRRAPRRKRVISVNDGFSLYFQYAGRDREIDERYVDTHADSDVGILMLQTPSTGVASWPSRVTSLLGGGMSHADWGSRRFGDRRTRDYIDRSIRGGFESMRVVSDRCHARGMEFHASLRMNLFFSPDGVLGSKLDRLFHGEWWFSHPEARKKGGVQLDYARPEVREYIVSIITELATLYDVDGINLDFTRWPPIADPDRHGNEVLTLLLEAVRRSLDSIAAGRGRDIALSVIVVDGYHARRSDGTLLSLADQRIDLASWMRRSLVDFVCVQAWDHRDYLRAARETGTPYFVTFDQESIHVRGGFRDDPEWRQSGRPDEDPVPGEERVEEPHLNSSLDPLEYYEAIARVRGLEPDGLCIVNNFQGWRCLRDFGDWEGVTDSLHRNEVIGQRIGSKIVLSRIVE